jgi:hypothetical protein
MPTLRCDCGTEVQVPDEEAQELTWCPRCHKTLIQPKSYQLPARNYRSGGAAAPRARGGPSGNGIGVAGRVIGILAMAVVFGLGRASCHHSHSDAPNFSVPRFDPKPVPRFEPQIEWPPPNNWPGAGPQNPAGPDNDPWRDEPELRKVIEALRQKRQGENPARPGDPAQPPEDRP